MSTDLPLPDAEARAVSARLLEVLRDRIDAAGLFGRVYWYALWPIHQLVFGGMVDWLERGYPVVKGLPPS